jgi:hypothetical protein
MGKDQETALSREEMAMKNLVLTSLFIGGLVQLATGCVIVGDDSPDNPPPPPPPPDAMPPPPPPGPGAFDVAWTLLGGEAQAEVTCPPDVAGVDVIVDPDPGVDGDEIATTFDCSAGGGLVEFDSGTYDLWVELFDANGDLVAQSDIVLDVALGADQTVPLDFSFSVDRGQFDLSWTITENGQPSTCDAVQADDVSLLLTIADSTEAFDFLFTCADGKATTDPLPLLDYVGIATLLDSGADPNDPADDIVLGDSLPRNVSLLYGNEYADLGNFEFQF